MGRCSSFSICFCSIYSLLVLIFVLSVSPFFWGLIVLAEGYGKQGGRHLYPEETSHGFIPTRPNDKILDDESCRASGSAKYSRNSRESRGSFGQKDWKGHSWEATPSPNGPGRPNDVTDQQRSVDDMHLCNSSNPHSDSANSWDQPQSKDQHEKNGSVNATASSGLKIERENSFLKLV